MEVICFCGGWMSTWQDPEPRRRHISSHVSEDASRLSWRGKSYPKCGQHGLWTGNKGKSEPSTRHKPCCFLTALHSSLHDFPSTPSSQTLLPLRCLEQAVLRAVTKGVFSFCSSWCAGLSWSHWAFFPPSLTHLCPSIIWDQWLRGMRQVHGGAVSTQGQMIHDS